MRAGVVVLVVGLLGAVGGACPVASVVDITTGSIAAGSGFAQAVVVGRWASGDVLVVGAPGDDVAATNAGAAVVFERDKAGVWAEAVVLRPAGLAPSDAFGSAVAVGAGSLEGIIAVSAPKDDAKGASAGAVYFFERDATGEWVSPGVVRPDGLGPGDLFGTSVAAGDGFFVVGAFGDDDEGIGAGAAYVIERDASGVWVETAKLLASDGSNGDWLGWSAGAGDDLVILGAVFDGPWGTDSGSAYIFRRGASGGWSQEAKLIPSDGAITDTFGWSVAIEGDVAAVGAQKDDDEGVQSGSVYIFERGGGAWVEAQKLVDSASGAGAEFGTSVSISDGVLAVGAPAGAGGGAVVLYGRDARGEWVEVDRITAGAAGWEVGWAVSMSEGVVVGGAPGGGLVRVGDLCGGAPACVGDVDGSGGVDSADLNLLLAGFGCVGDCAADVDGDGDVDSGDLNQLLAGFGDMCAD